MENVQKSRVPYKNCSKIMLRQDFSSYFFSKVISIPRPFECNKNYGQRTSENKLAQVNPLTTPLSVRYFNNRLHISLYDIRYLEKFLNCLKLLHPQFQLDWSILKCARSMKTISLISCWVGTAYYGTVPSR